jgi:hypothetical protein
MESKDSEMGLWVGKEALEPEEKGDGTEKEEYVGLMGEDMMGRRETECGSGMQFCMGILRNGG